MGLKKYQSESESSKSPCISAHLSNSAKISRWASSDWRALINPKRIIFYKTGGEQHSLQITCKSRNIATTIDHPQLYQCLMTRSKPKFCSQSIRVLLLPPSQNKKNWKTHWSAGLGGGLWCFLFGGHCIVGNVSFPPSFSFAWLFLFRVFLCKIIKKEPPDPIERRRHAR